LRYPSDLTEDEWALVAPLISPAKRGGNKRHVDVREVMNGIMYVFRPQRRVTSSISGVAKIRSVNFLNSAA
jgi:transposase